MQTEKKFWVGLFVVWPILAVVFCVWGAKAGYWFPPTPGVDGSTASASPIGDQIDDLFYMILLITTITFILTHIALAYAMWKGAKKTDADKAWFSHGSHSLEVIWTIVPAVVLLFIAFVQLPVWRDFRVISSYPQEAKDYPIAEVTARQFEWRIRYPAPGKKLQPTPQPDDVYYVNELHVPSGRPVLIYLRTQDVQHAFFLPELRVKQDAVPGLRIPVWFEAKKSETYTLVCAELCGWGHYKMGAEMIAESPESFDAYIKKLQEEQEYDGVPIADADFEDDEV